MNWSEFVYYDPTSPSGLRWAVSRGRYKKVGDVVGSLHKTLGYWMFGLTHEGSKKTHYCHRAIWELHNGPIPEGMEVDHENIDRSRNVYENLRLLTKKKNLRNSSKQSRNKSGITGVFKSQGRWIASWMKLDGKEQQRAFSIKKLGEDAAKAAAIAERQTQIALLNLQGAGYTALHGTLPKEN